MRELRNTVGKIGFASARMMKRKKFIGRSDCIEAVLSGVHKPAIVLIRLGNAHTEGPAPFREPGF